MNLQKCGRLTTLMLLFTIGLTGSPIAQPIENRWLSFDAALEQAATDEKWILLDIWAPWCGWCLKMQKEVYPALSSETASKFIFSKLNYDREERKYFYKNRRLASSELARLFKVDTVPAIVILDSQGDYEFHTTGFIDAKNLEYLLQEFTK